MVMAADLKQTLSLASISGVTVLKSPYYAEGVQINWSLIKPQDVRLVELLFEFVFAPVVIDTFNNKHNQRKAFWKLYEPDLSEGDKKIVRQNPLKWGLIGKAAALNTILMVNAPEITICAYSSMSTLEKLEYLDAVRQAIIKKFTTS